jgi:hypothetical protein
MKQNNKIMEQIQRGCLTKKNHTVESANRYIDFRLQQGLILYYYKCDLCGSLHITKSVPNKELQLSNRLELV